MAATVIRSTPKSSAITLALLQLLVLCFLKEVVAAKNYTLKPRVVLPEDYVKEVRPPSQKGSPVVVEFSIFVVDINSINVEDMDFRVDMFVHQKWVESRLDLHDDIFEEGDDHVILPPEFFDNLWQPDPYFLNSKISEIATLTHKFSSVTLYKNSTVRYACMMHAIIACQMEFQLYPMDIQICPIYIESFSYHNQKIRLKWADNGVTINPELKLLQYNLGQPLQLEETDGYMPEKYGNFSRLAVYFRFERQIGHHLIQTFAPSALVVMLSWFSFWLGLDAIPGRVTLLVTCMLTLVTMFTGMRADIPPVAYVKVSQDAPEADIANHILIFRFYLPASREGTRSVDGRLYAVRVFRPRGVCRREGAGRAVPVPGEQGAEGAADAHQRDGEGPVRGYGRELGGRHGERAAPEAHPNAHHAGPGVAAGERWAAATATAHETADPPAKHPVRRLDRHGHRHREDYVARDRQDVARRLSRAVSRLRRALLADPDF
ncbi:glycine receptor subunit alpha-4 isoform X3 [Anopheles stephensi]|uniref:glycine receptor subunit alpha-4 isoform X3 n=1 Tax=Anopheles stephensi TaxID=30069 RepID=UPI00165885F8|nr:glycine receptor subunit alpha-4 isoform X3 [Anopheles stephensi]XP_035892374.1 glycine receptor subunit alpha-4 isoform X3 [Anopheles stephensi]XP_035892375.1 glycine receptor subunit alpha-4 isoform X3 [Anopheles stephensi]XP_035892376.1 glycine receptor subunit alpha-4 isoform X3 [Anopheles stephensi]XP_035892377.1 glycine receptor subunit alpha-4 isoform X3 [Anopheles stephensi]XP_035892379.1 glycine receptor subunit alpha-4 isoform X3 [Anopheles stephensi]